jgi:hypothetical protein
MRGVSVVREGWLQSGFRRRGGRRNTRLRAAARVKDYVRQTLRVAQTPPVHIHSHAHAYTLELRQITGMQGLGDVRAHWRLHTREPDYC